MLKWRFPLKSLRGIEPSESEPAQGLMYETHDTQEKNNGFPFLDIFGYLKNTHKNPKFGRVRQVPMWELDWKFRGWDLSHFAKFGIFIGIL